MRLASERKVNRKDAPMQGNYVLAAAAAKSGFNPTTLILIVVVVGAFYFLMIRPQKSSTVSPGATVRTTAGMYATVVDVDGDDVILEVAPGVEVRYMKRAIMDVVTAGEEPVEDTYETDADETDTDEIADDDTVDDETVVAETAEPSDVEETAYEQATGVKKD
jgi:preprotein translocase subunit YajC